MSDLEFRLESDYEPQGDQPTAIAELSEGLERGLPAQTLLGVTGSGKTFTMAQVIARSNRPALVLAHNKTLAAQRNPSAKASPLSSRGCPFWASGKSGKSSADKPRI